MGDRLLPQGEPGPVEKYLFSPDMIMVHQGEIGISDEQREEIIAGVQEAQTTIMRLQWEMHGAMGQLEQDLKNTHVDEAKIRSTSEKITKIEGEIKLTHLTMLIRIKNRLSEQQQRQLSDLRLALLPPPR
ncbi:MAG: hypothetical protein HYX75_22495 [Acidobacteria bacterium]|nr:hypothetical protein [Acidobacteriota bacterium]